MNEGILSVIGNTPVVRLTKIFRPMRFRLFAKLEALNPGGSMKDRPAYAIIEEGLRTGDICPETVVIESSSGNMGIGLAQACSYFGLKLICVVDAKTTVQNIRLLEAYGAEVDLVTEPDPESGEFLHARLRRVQELLALTEKGFWPNQYANLCNSRAHHRTMHELVTELGSQVDYLFCATSTCGTMRGCVEYARARGLATKVIAVDAVGSVIFGGPKGKRLIPGHGAALRPQLYRHDMADECIHVTDLECVVGCRRLARSEAILAGGSSGAIVMAIEQYGVPDGATCAAILPDRGERYLDTIFSDAWVEEHFGEISHLWQSPAGTQVCETVTY